MKKLLAKIPNSLKKAGKMGLGAVAALGLTALPAHAAVTAPVTDWATFEINDIFTWATYILQPFLPLIILGLGIILGPRLIRKAKSMI